MSLSNHYHGGYRLDKRKLNGVGDIHLKWTDSKVIFFIYSFQKNILITIQQFTGGNLNV